MLNLDVSILFFIQKLMYHLFCRSVIYKEQVRLNQVATNALMARLEAQKAICDSAEKDLHKKFKQREEIEKQLRPEREHARKRSRMDDTLFEEKDSRSVLYLPGVTQRTPIHKELRVFLEEEQKASEAGLSSNEERRNEEVEEEPPKLGINFAKEKHEEHDKSIVAFEEYPIEDQLKRLEIGEEKRQRLQFPVLREPEIQKVEEEEEEIRKERGKGNIERWLQMLLENTQEETDPQATNENKTSRTDDIIKKLDEKYPQKDRASITQEPEKQQIVVEKEARKLEEEITEIEPAETVTEKSNVVEQISIVEGVGSRKSFEVRERTEKHGKEKSLARSESARAFRRIPSSPSLILKKGVDCIRKKPIVMDDDDGSEFHAAGNSFIKSSIKTIKKAVKI